MPRTHAPCGGRLRPDGTWKEFAAQVEEAAAKRARAPKPKPQPVNLANLRPGGVEQLRQAPRCVATARISGERCKGPAVRGAALCSQHGGLLVVPAHPANARRLEQLQGIAAAQEARQAFFAHPPAIRLATSQAWKEAQGAKRRRRNKWRHMLEGAQALSLNDNGRAFRRWLASLNDTETCDTVTPKDHER